MRSRSMLLYMMLLRYAYLFAFLCTFMYIYRVKASIHFESVAKRRKSFVWSIGGVLNVPASAGPSFQDVCQELDTSGLGTRFLSTSRYILYGDFCVGNL
jgi:hypothetical protein